MSANPRKRAAGAPQVGGRSVRARPGGNDDPDYVAEALAMEG